MRDASHQNLLDGRRHSQWLEPLRVSEQGEIALVRVQGMRLRVWREDDGTLEVGVPQRGTGRSVEREVREAVVDQVDRKVTVPARHRASQTRMDR